MGKIYVSERDIVCPGELLAEGIDIVAGKNTYRIGNKIYAKRVGMVHIEGKVVGVIALSGQYVPEKDHMVIGIISDVGFTTWTVDLGCPYPAFLPLSEAVNEFVDILRADLSTYYDIGDVIFAKVLNVTRHKIVQLTMKAPGCRKLIGGMLVKVSSTKVPRIIGKKGSMVNMIKSITKCQIIVGQNGIVWIKGNPDMELLAARAIHRIARESHIKGLTEKIKCWLEEEVKKCQGSTEEKTTSSAQ